VYMYVVSLALAVRYRVHWTKCYRGHTFISLSAESLSTLTWSLARVPGRRDCLLW